MELQYLDFDYSEDAEGIGTFDAMASVLPGQLAALHAEVTAVLAWAHGQFPDACGPLEDGCEWHYDLQGVQEVQTPLAIEFHPDSGRITAGLGQPAAARTTLTLALSGTAAFCAALREAFELS